MNLPSFETQTLRSKKAVGDPYLQLQINSQTQVALPMNMTQEVLITSASRLTIMPNMPPCLLGLLNQRSRIFWVIDLALLLGLQPLGLELQQYSIAIIRSRNNALGLAVEAVKGVIRFPKEVIQSPIGTVEPELTPYLQGCIAQERQILLILSPEAILNAPILQHNLS
ncbi:chemotaxis protein CheW [Crocosphaera sp. UHCC 0190]|uniref:chemotaxis protein CheW n=1 Tax=Crocosphaera sp. UHCC 0190 TaxID=3110246 RepID=UPI002B1F113D|nr:chemotaxis protein CheW [Crocosphaera sp. UHCC 0190]MEA5511450.1 chemotaxis protein CheW [Crocosphaera sp. UHCC 0190]